MGTPGARGLAVGTPIDVVVLVTAARLELVEGTTVDVMVALLIEVETEVVTTTCVVVTVVDVPEVDDTNGEDADANEDVLVIALVGILKFS